MTNLTEEDTKISSVWDLTSNFPALPSFKFSAVPPTYETSPSSTASTGQAESKARQTVASIFITLPFPNRSNLPMHDKRRSCRLHLHSRRLSAEALCFANPFRVRLERKCAVGQTPTHLSSTTGADGLTATDSNNVSQLVPQAGTAHTATASTQTNSLHAPCFATSARINGSHLR